MSINYKPLRNASFVFVGLSTNVYFEVDQYYLLLLHLINSLAI